MVNDVSGTIVSGGTAQVLIQIPANSVGYCVQNLDSTEDLWINETGDATAGPGSIKIPAGALYETPTDVNATYNSSSVSIFSAKTGHAFTARRW